MQINHPVVTDVSFNVNESGNIEMLPQYATPYKDPKKYKNQMQHQLRFFRFNHRTHVPTGGELNIVDFFAEEGPAKANDDDVKLLEEARMRPQRHREEPFNGETQDTNQN